jgi:hypothetical protein
MEGSILKADKSSTYILQGVVTVTQMRLNKIKNLET